MDTDKKEKLKEWKKKYGHAWIMGYILIYLPWFFCLEKRISSGYAIMHTALDDCIPFIEYFIIPYLLWFVYVACTVLHYFFTSRDDYYRLCTFLFVGMTLCLVICSFFPNGTDLRVEPDPDRNLCSLLVSLIHCADTPTNVFPSIHAYNSLGVHFSIVKSAQFRSRRGVKLASFVLMAAICLSTVFLKQHSVIDVVGAFLLGYAVYPFVYGERFADRRKEVRRKVLSH